MSCPVYLLTGFLGCGKTTLLARLLRDPAFSDTAVVINEFGQIGLDHVLVNASTDADVILLDSGCLCCAVTNTLQETLESLHFRRLRGEAPPFRRVIIETSGLADPGAIIGSLAGDPIVGRHYCYAGAVAAFDPLSGLDALTQFREAAVQIAVADRIAITKTDLASDAQIDAARLELRRHNATARIAVTAIPAGDAATVAKNAGVAELFQDLSAPLAIGSLSATRGATRLTHVLRYGISSHLIRHRDPVSWPGYARWVRYLQRHFAENLLRVKGLLRFEDGCVYAIHGVRLLFSPPATFDGPCPEGLIGSIVLITQNLTEAEVAASSAFLNAEGTG